MAKPWVVAITFAGGIASAQPKPAPPADPLVDADVPAPALDVGSAKLSMPAIPPFDIPPPNADGSRTTRELRIKGKPFLGREVTVKGFVTFAYDCVADVRKPGMTEKAAKDLIDRDPTLCERAKFYVGDGMTTRRDASLWVVDLPRPYNKLEIARIKKSDRTDPLKCEPNETDPKKKICPPYKAGDQVEVTGTFALSSAHNERNSDGLLIFKSMKNVTQRWRSPSWAVAAPWNPPPQPPLTTPPMTAIPKPRMIGKIRRSVFEASKRLAYEGTIAHGQRQWDVAIDRYTKATLRWKGHHAAWHGLASAHAHKGEWASAADAAWNATVVHRTNGMYRLMFGRALYEKTILQAKQDQARRENKPVDQVDVDLPTVNFEKALVELQLAIAFENRLWRAHYLIGSIHRHAGRAKDSAAAYTKACELGPTEPAPFIALAELYRTWDYAEPAIQVAERGTSTVAGTQQSELWFEVGMGYDDMRLDDKAIDAFNKSLAARADNHKTRFARGQAYYRKGAFDKAKFDLEEFSKLATGPTMDFFKQQAARMLMDIAAKPAKPKR